MVPSERSETLGRTFSSTAPGTVFEGAESGTLSAAARMLASGGLFFTGTAAEGAAGVGAGVGAGNVCLTCAWSGPKVVFPFGEGVCRQNLPATRMAASASTAAAAATSRAFDGAGGEDGSRRAAISCGVQRRCGSRRRHWRAISRKSGGVPSGSRASPSRKAARGETFWLSASTRVMPRDQTSAAAEGPVEANSGASYTLGRRGAAICGRADAVAGELKTVSHCHQVRGLQPRMDEARGMQVNQHFQRRAQHEFRFLRAERTAGKDLRKVLIGELADHVQKLGVAELAGSAGEQTQEVRMGQLRGALPALQQGLDPSGGRIRQQFEGRLFLQGAEAGDEDCAVISAALKLAQREPAIHDVPFPLLPGITHIPPTAEKSRWLFYAPGGARRQAINRAAPGRGRQESTRLRLHEAVLCWASGQDDRLMADHAIECVCQSGGKLRDQQVDV